MTKYVVATHHIGEDIQLEEVYASSPLMAAKAFVDTTDWDEQPETLEDLQAMYYDYCEEYVSVIEINKKQTTPGIPFGQVAIQ